MTRDDDFASNQLLRKSFRTKKKEINAEREDRFHKNIYFPLVEESEQEVEERKEEFRLKKLMSELEEEERAAKKDVQENTDSVSDKKRKLSQISTSSVRSRGIFDGSKSYQLVGKERMLHEVRVSAVSKRRRIESQVLTTARSSSAPVLSSAGSVGYGKSNASSAGAPPKSYAQVVVKAKPKV
tara:strand:+ start:99 stop:647 length:549 start_codon:yes stop_codon:yes gene_type:complete